MNDKNPWNSPEWNEYVERVHRELIPKIKDTNIFVSITPSTPDKVDVKFAVELGLAIMYNKPIIACIQPGTPIPEKLARVVDKFVELDLKDPAGRERLVEAIHEMSREQGND